MIFKAQFSFSLFRFSQTLGEFSLKLPFFSLLLLNLFVSGVFAQSIEVESFKYEGLQNVDAQALDTLLGEPSRISDSSLASAALKKLYSAGFFRRAKVEYLPKTKVLVFVLEEKPPIRRVFVRGNEELGESEIEEVLEFDRGRFYDASFAGSLADRIRELYESEGYFEIELNHSITENSNGSVDLSFEIAEGREFHIEEVKVTGLRTADEGEVLSILETKEYVWWKSWIVGTGRLEKEVLSVDQQRIRQWLLDKGFLQSSVSEAEIDLGDGEIVVTFHVNEGDQYRIRNIETLGPLLEEDRELTLEGVESEAGEIFNATQARDDSFRVSDNFGNYGYAFANVIPETRISRERPEVDLVFRIEPGSTVDVREIRIEGNTKTLDKVIRRELIIQEQELYSKRKLDRSQRLLQRLGFFEEVDISTSPTGSDDEVDLNVKLREARTGTFSAGAGFSSADGILLNSRLSENNVLGTGRRAVLNVDFGDQRNNFIFSLQDRRINDSFVSGSLSVLSTDRIFPDFDRELAGGSVTFGYPLERLFGEWSEDINVSLKYEVLNVEIANVDPEDASQLVIDSEGRTSSSGFTPVISRNTIDNPLNPTSGSRQRLSVELTGLGGTEEYFLFEGLNQIYYPLIRNDWGEVTFSWRSRFGYGETFNGEVFPLFRRFFPGGINSVRGFEIRTLGPKDENGDEFGGSKQVVNNFEVIFPLLSSVGLRGVLFYDVGQAFDDDESISINGLRQAVGYGIRWTSPLGPIRVEFGFPLDKEEGEDSSVTLFSFGAPI